MRALQKLYLQTPPIVLQSLFSPNPVGSGSTTEQQLIWGWEPTLNLSLSLERRVLMNLRGLGHAIRDYNGKNPSNNNTSSNLDLSSKKTATAAVTARAKSIMSAIV